MNQTVKRTMALVLGMLPALQGWAGGLPGPEEKAFKGRVELTDGTLGGVRGSFISADQILYFGVEMYTEWRDANGQLIASSGLNIGIDRNNGHPAVTVSNNVQTPNAALISSNSAAGQISSGGLNQVQGVSQLVQTTGNGNGVTNSIGIDVSAHRPTIAGLANPGGNNAVMNSQTGVTAQTFVYPTSAGVSVTVPGQGTASQSVASVVGMQQRAQVYGDANSVHNQLNMVIQVQNSGASSAVPLNNLSQTVQGLWQAGIH